MTGKIVNLNRARKGRARAEAKAQADANAQRFGRTKGQKARDAADTERARRHLDDHNMGPKDTIAAPTDD